MPDLNLTEINPPMMTEADDAIRPTHVRWHVMLLLLLITALTFLDRLNLSIAGEYIQDEFHLGTQTMGWILSAFVLGYALFQVPGGWLGDRYGPRAVITRAIVWWSIFSAATAIAPRLPFAHWFGFAWSFSIVRFLIGIGEGASFPNSNKIVALWMGKSQRGIGNSIFLAGIGVGGAIAPISIAWTMKTWGWRTSFYLCGCVGLLIALLWQYYVTDRPEAHRALNSVELAIIREGHEVVPRSIGRSVPQSISLSRLFTSTSAVGLVFSNFFVGYASYLYYTWFYLYLVQVRHMSLLRGGLWGSTPFVAIAFLSPLGGWISDALVAHLGRRRGRRIAVWLGLFLASSLLWIGSHTVGNTIAIILMASAAGFLAFATTSWWATCIDLAPNNSGSLAGLMNMGGNLGGWVSPVFTAYIASHFGWTRALEFAAVLPLIAGVLWLMVNADQNLELRLQELDVQH